LVDQLLVDCHGVGLLFSSSHGRLHSFIYTLYLGCKQNLGHPVNDLFDLRTDRRPHETDGESAAVKSSNPVETASRQEIECRHGGSEHDQPVCDAPRYPYQNEPIWSNSEKTIARAAFDAALERDLQEVTQEAKQKANQIKKPANVWELERYLTQRRKQIDHKHNFRSSRLTRGHWETFVRTSSQ
jgi:Photoprotection regulator fluorescence recovery protein